MCNKFQVTSLSLAMMPTGAGSRHGRQRGQGRHVALPALGRPEAQPRLGALVRVGRVVPEQAAATPGVAATMEIIVKQKSKSKV